MERKQKIINVLLIVGFVCYICFLLGVIVFKYVSPLALFDVARPVSRSINLMPFNDIINGYFNKMDVIGNIILFIPLGIYLSMYFKNTRSYRIILRIVLVSLMFEVTQFIFGIGASDITDLITNGLGGVVGIGIYGVIKYLFKTEIRVKWFVGICSSLVVVGVGGILIGIMIYN